MKIVADEHIPFLRGVLESHGDVIYLPGRRIASEDVRDADALLVRTRTRCNDSLLEGSRVRFIGSATIGFDHIDLEYCARRGIQWVNAPGCNAFSVMQYVASALAYLANSYNLELPSLSLGIIGAGNVGTKVEKLAAALGMRVLVNDPPRARREGPRDFVSLRTIMEEADIITIHVPLDRHSPDRTFHLYDRDFFSGLKRAPFLINTARGEVLETEAVKEALLSGKVRAAVIDVWENEPGIDRMLLSAADIATPHIAGYSVDGKANGTAMVVRALSRFFQIGLDQWYPDSLPGPGDPFIREIPSDSSVQSIILACIRSTYRVEEDSQRLKQFPLDFEKQREKYPLRREFPSYVVVNSHAWDRAGRRLSELGFSAG